LMALLALALKYVTLCALHKASSQTLLKIWVMHKFKGARTRFRGISVCKNMYSLSNRALSFHESRRCCNSKEMLTSAQIFMIIFNITGSTYFRTFRITSGTTCVGAACNENTACYKHEYFEIHRLTPRKLTPHISRARYERRANEVSELNVIVM